MATGALMLGWSRSRNLGGHPGRDAVMELAPRRYGDTVVLSPRARLDQSTAEEFKDGLMPYLERCAPGQELLVLDLSGVEYISSAGLRILMLARKHARAQEGTLVVAGLQPVVKEIFEISRFTLVFEVFPTVREALARISAPALAAFDAG
jgi:anti-anti-sigma factor